MCYFGFHPICVTGNSLYRLIHSVPVSVTHGFPEVVSIGSTFIYYLYSCDAL